MTGLVCWFTGLSGSGKSTICQAVCQELTAAGLKVEVLDGDDLRKNITRGLGFTKGDRDENVHRIGFVARLLSKHGVTVLVAVISPYRDARNAVRESCGNFIEVYVNAPLEVCEERDVKGLYAKARAGELWNLTGVDDPYEKPLWPEVVCNTGKETLQQSRDKVLKAIAEFHEVHKFYAGQ